MPAQPACFHRLTEILGALWGMTSTHLDRLAAHRLRSATALRVTPRPCSYGSGSWDGRKGTFRPRGKPSQ